jgi:hypothetical protein
MGKRLLIFAAIVTLAAVIGMFVSPGFQVPRTAMRADKSAKATFAALSAAASLLVSPTQIISNISSLLPLGELFDPATLDDVPILRC